MNTNQYLDEAFYRNISTSKDKTFDFADDKSIKYRTVVNGMSDVSFQVKMRHFVPFEKQHINPKSTAPYLVKLKVDSDAITPFSLLKEALQRNLGTVVDCWYENMAYLNTDENVFKQLHILIKYEEQQLHFTIAVRHIIFHAVQNPRVKYLLQAVDIVQKHKHQSAGRKSKVPKLNIEAAAFLLPPTEINSVCLINRVDKLTLEHIDRYRLLPYADYNNLMNSFVMHIVFCNGSHESKATSQIFLSRSIVMCFTCNFTADMFYELFYLRDTKYGIKTKTCSLCTSIWTYHLLLRIGDLSKILLVFRKAFFHIYNRV